MQCKRVLIHKLFGPTKHRQEQQRTWDHTITKNDKGL